MRTPDTSPSPSPWAALRAAHAAAAPASTLLIATILTLLIALCARVAAADVPSSIVVSQHAMPGGLIEVAVEANVGEDIAVWLPGLVHERVPLEHDARSGYYLGAIAVPGSAPDKGWCTVRVVFEDRISHDLRVPLVVDPAPSS